MGSMQGWKAELAAKGRSNRFTNNLGKSQAEQKNPDEPSKDRQDSGVPPGKKAGGGEETYKKPHKHCYQHRHTDISWKRWVHKLLQNSGTLHSTLGRNPSRKSSIRIYNKKHPLNNLGNTKVVKCSTIECGGHEKISWSFLLDAQKQAISSNTWALLLLSWRLRIKSICRSGQWFVQASTCKFSTNKQKF